MPAPSVNSLNMTLVAAPEQQATVKKEKDSVRAEANHRQPFSLLREDSHQCLRRADGARSSVYRGE